ncbi:MAG TPA: hypothetical protein VHC19_00100 [Pirellulales bacterium]|nr:hypothetical protein [Pirellulales bacterium]
MSAALQPNVLLESLRPPRDAVRRRLARVRWRLRGRLAIAGLTWLWTALVLLAAASLAADWLLRFSLPVRQILLALAVAALAAIAYRKLLAPLAVRLDDLDLAAILDRRCRGYGQRVAAVLELPRLLEAGIGVSPSMIQAAVLEHAETLEATDVSAAFDRRGPWRMAALIAITGIAAAAFVYLQSETAGLWARRWLQGSTERWPQRNYLAVIGLKDGEALLVPRGESLLVNVESQRAFSGRPGGWSLDGRGAPLSIRTLRQPQAEVPEKVSIKYRPVSGAVRQGNFTSFQDGRFRYELPPIVEPTSFTVSGGDDWFGPIRIEPIDRPGIDQLAIVARPPGSKQSETFAHTGADTPLLFLKDSELELQLTANAPLASASLVAQPGPAPALVRIDETHYATRWKMDQSQTFEIRLVGRQAGLESKPYFVSIGLLVDRPPRLTLRSSGVGKRVTPQAKIPLQLRAQDDFGLKSLAMEMEQTVPSEKKTETSVRKTAIELPEPAAGEKLTDFETQPLASLAQYGLAAGTLVKLRATGEDNCAQGAQAGASRWLSFQLVTAEELFYEILMRQRAERAKFAAALETAKAQTEPLAGELESGPLAAVARKHQLVARQAWQTGNRLEATLVEMTLNDLGGEEARQLLKTKVIDAIRRLHAEPMTQLRAALDAAVAAGQPSAEQLAEVRRLHGEVAETMQKVLDQMSLWENFIDVLNQLDEIVKLQNDVLNATEQEKKKRTNDLFDD